jgi:hypothetical protein
MEKKASKFGGKLRKHLKIVTDSRKWTLFRLGDSIKNILKKQWIVMAWIILAQDRNLLLNVRVT